MDQEQIDSCKEERLTENELRKFEVTSDYPVIDLRKHVIQNKQRKFGENLHYVKVFVITEKGGVTIKAGSLLTLNDLQEGINRALRNKEDIAVTPSLQAYFDSKKS